MTGREAPAGTALRIAVCGAGVASADQERLAEEVGRLLAERGAVVVCGGMSGVMDAAARGAARAGGLSVGVLPGATDADASPWLTIPLPTGMGEMRNALVVRFADALIAIGGEWGTLSEVALAMKVGVPVLLLAPGLTRNLPIPLAGSAADAVEQALSAAATRRQRD